MNILVVGCRRVGATLVRRLEDAGHDVSVLDDSADNLDRLNNFEHYTFGGLAFLGVPIDVDVLRRAGIETCDAVAAVTPDDNINIMVSEIARDIFHVERVFTRISDPGREKIFSTQFGLTTICPTELTVNAMIEGVNQAEAADREED